MPISSGYGKRLPMHVLREPVRYERVYESKCSLCTHRRCFLCEHDTPLRDEILFNKKSTKSLPDLDKIKHAKLRRDPIKKKSSTKKTNNSRDLNVSKSTNDTASTMSTIDFEKKGFLFCIRRRTSFSDLVL
jgi:hypothetical protein